MTVRLRLLDRVSFDEEAIAGDRLGALLGALAQPVAAGRPDAVVRDARLIEQIWGDAAPANPTKALQVLVSRVRQVAADLVVRSGSGYRLGLTPEESDVGEVRRRVAAVERDWRQGRAAQAGRSAVALGDIVVAEGGAAALADVRAEIAGQIAATGRYAALGLAAEGRHGEALPLLLDQLTHRPDDPEVLAARWRAEAATVGAAVALESFEDYRRRLVERTGADPDPALQAVQRELLAADRPVRGGIRHDLESLFGRDDDLVALRTSLTAHRLTTVLGPGGIGKTRIVQLLAAESTLPRVYVVELVGVGTGEDVLAEIGAALGIRGSVAARHSLTPAQQADLRGRLAQELDTAPTLLVLDNCEHVLEAVAGLVAFLLVTTRDLRLLTTSRAPLRVAAEHVVTLSQLDADDAARLFAERALAVRSDVALDPGSVAQVVARLDGLPLAIELAAARVRTMSVAEVAAALSDRFALLRTRDRTAPERHRTLGAVIAWSWGLLAPDEQRALAWLSVFHDGFDTAAARAVLGPDGPDLVEELVDQSLVVVTESGGVSRFRVLETIREYAGHRLTERGDRGLAEAAQDEWALALVERDGLLFVAEDQIAAVDRLVREENNLTDVLRRALARPEPAVVARMLATLGSLWTMTGAHARVFSVIEGVRRALTDWEPPAGLRAQTQDAVAVALMHASWMGGEDQEALAGALMRLGEPETAWARTAHTMYLVDGRPPREGLQALLASTADPAERGLILMWLAIMAENDGDLEASADCARAALAGGSVSPYLQGALHAQLAQVLLSLDDHRAAARHAAAAHPLLVSLHATDDAVAMQIGIAVSHLLDGDPDACERDLRAVEGGGEPAQLGSRTLLDAAWAELALARGDVDRGLRRYDDAVRRVASVRVPGMVHTPWLNMAGSGCVVAMVHHAGDDRAARAGEVADLIAEGVRRQLADADRAGYGDLPLTGLGLLGVAAHDLRWGRAPGRTAAVDLLAIAHQWRYSKVLPSVAWAPLAALAETVAPGVLAEHLVRYADRPPADSRARAASLLAQRAAGASGASPRVTSAG